MEIKKWFEELYKVLIKIKSDPAKCEQAKKNVNRILLLLILLGIAFGNDISILVSFVSIALYIILFILTK